MLKIFRRPLWISSRFYHDPGISHFFLLWTSWKFFPNILTLTPLEFRPLEFFTLMSSTGGWRIFFLENPFTYKLFLSVHGNWTTWSEWSTTCNRPCNNGTLVRTRTCTEPIPMFGGDDCTGEPKDTRLCNTHPCPSKWIFLLKINKHLTGLL